MNVRDQIPATRRWVVKIGSALLTGDGQGLSREVLAGWVDQMADWVRSGRELVLVSSGAVAEGMGLIVISLTWADIGFLLAWCYFRMDFYIHCLFADAPWVCGNKNDQQTAKKGGEHCAQTMFFFVCGVATPFVNLLVAIRRFQAFKLDEPGVLRSPPHTDAIKRH